MRENSALTERIFLIMIGLFFLCGGGAIIIFSQELPSWGYVLAALLGGAGVSLWVGSIVGGSYAVKKFVDWGANHPALAIFFLIASALSQLIKKWRKSHD